MGLVSLSYVVAFGRRGYIRDSFQGLEGSSESLDPQLGLSRMPERMLRQCELGLALSFPLSKSV